MERDGDGVVERSMESCIVKRQWWLENIEWKSTQLVRAAVREPELWR